METSVRARNQIAFARILNTTVRVIVEKITWTLGKIRVVKRVPLFYDVLYSRCRPPTQPRVVSTITSRRTRGEKNNDQFRD